MAGLGALGGGGLFAGKSLAVLGTGLLAGAVGGGVLVASGAVRFGGHTATAGGPPGAANGPGLQVVPCPDQGPVLGTVAADQKVLVTGRSADGGWLQLYWPGPGLERAWTRAGVLRLDGDAASLPVAACAAPPTATPRPTEEPTPTAAPTPVVTASPTPSPGPTPTATARPTPSPTLIPNAAPTVSDLRADTTTVSYDQGSYCPTARKAVTISVTASDADGIASVTLYWKKPGATNYAARPMTLSGGRYAATLDTKADGITGAGRLAYYVVARDANARPKSTRSPASGTLAVTVKVCANSGPTFTLLQASPTTIVADPSNAGCGGSTLSGLTAQATDPDGVTSVQLFWRRPGSTTYESRPFSADGSTWYSFINTVASVDDITRPGTISWYAVATDGKGKARKSAVGSITVVYCDSPASFDFAGVTRSVYADPACVPSALAVPLNAADPDDRLAGYSDSSRLRVVLSWKASNLRGFVSYSGETVATFQKGTAFLASIPTVGWVAGLYSISLTATSTDVYGGTSRSGTTTAQFSVYSSCKG